MSPIAVALLAFACLCAAGLGGAALNLRDELKDPATRDAVRVAQGIIASLSSLVLGLVLASASGHYREQGEKVRQLATQVFVMDRLLAEHGEDAAPARATLRRALGHAVDEVWSRPTRRLVGDDTRLFEDILRLPNGTPRQAFAQAQALSQMVALLQLRASLTTAEQGGSVQRPLVIVLIAWFVCLFLAIGLFVRPNAVVVVTTVLCGATVSTGFFLILELAHPFDGLLALPDEVLRQALGGG
jgi:hypothetical protein